MRFVAPILGTAVVLGAARPAGRVPIAEPRPSSVAAQPTRWGFDRDAVAAPPSGFELARTGEGRPGQWLVQEDREAPSAPNVLAQLDADPTDQRFPLAVASEPSVRNLRLSVRCKSISGAVDRACGLVFRYRDADTYYVARASALEGGVRLHHVAKGAPRQLGDWTGPIKSGTWHELSVEAEGDRLEVRWEGQSVIDVHDAAIAEAGKVGVWTRADSVTYFDDLVLTPLAL